MRKNLLFVGWGTKFKTYPFEVARKKNLTLFLATTQNYPSWVLKYIPKSRIILTNIYDSEQLIIDTLFFAINNEIKFHAILTFFEMCIVQTADLASVFKCKFISPSAARNSSGNKLLMRTRCEDAGINTPKFDVFNSVDEGFKKLNNIGVPAVIKPVKSGHSFGAMYINSSDRSKFIDSFVAARKQLDGNADEWMSFYNSYKNHYLIEEFLEGIIISVDGLVQNSKALICGISSFVLSKPPLLIQEGVYIPAIGLSETTKNKCFLQTKKIIKVLGFDNCAFHCEMKITKKGPILLEIAARPPGGYMLEGYREAYGIDFASLYIDLCLGNEIKITQEKIKKYCVQRGFFAQKRGIIKQIKGMKEIKKIKSLKKSYFSKKDDLIDFQYNTPDCLFYYELSCDSIDQLKCDEEIIKKYLGLDYYPTVYFLYKKFKKYIKNVVKTI